MPESSTLHINPIKATGLLEVEDIHVLRLALHGLHVLCKPAGKTTQKAEAV